MGEGIPNDPSEQRPQRAPVGRMVVVGLVGLVSSPLALLIGGARVPWAALPLLLPLLLAPLYLVRFDRPHLLAYGLVTAGVLVIALQLALLAVALGLARRTPRRTRRERWVLAGWVLVFVAASVAGSQLIQYQREHQLEPFRIPSGSMLPTLLPGDCVLVEHRPSGPVRRGDLIVFQPDPRAGVDVGGPWMKRVVAIEGDVVETQGHEVLINGAPLQHRERPCAPGTTETPTGRCASEAVMTAGPSYEVLWGETHQGSWGPRTLRPGEVFVLGDNRDNSIDSRHLGPVPGTAVIGRVLVVWFSWWEGKARWSRVGLEL